MPDQRRITREIMRQFFRCCLNIKYALNCSMHEIWHDSHASDAVYTAKCTFYFNHTSFNLVFLLSTKPPCLPRADACPHLQNRCDEVARRVAVVCSPQLLFFFDTDVSTALWQPEQAPPLVHILAIVMQLPQRMTVVLVEYDVSSVIRQDYGFTPQEVYSILAILEALEEHLQGLLHCLECLV